LSRPFPSRSSSSHSGVRVNGKIRAREVRVISADGQQMGIHTLAEAINMASLYPAQLARLPHKGRVAAGCDADLIVFNDAFEVLGTVFKGELNTNFTN